MKFIIAVLLGAMLGSLGSALWHRSKESAMIKEYNKNQVQVNQRMGRTIHGLPVRNKDMN